MEAFTTAAESVVMLVGGVEEVVDVIVVVEVATTAAESVVMLVGGVEEVVDVIVVEVATTTSVVIKYVCPKVSNDLP